ncbi:glutathione-dependent disulfide-bond oxidoreductase [Sphingomonadaceae bacterium G21617-S1]|uniref:glutathione-dependent disulfide-bond oxidoreductase n=1 Tax=Rhizorhabdus sp. TaxID=1968843 RepID=UPI0011F4D37B|nr:glutathione-dependent disulfide-bond oxidoreductase [Rhizorhabdus sp.]MBD3759527.1 glutathione-dependent disulfide-bond oxidoreductase [Rhizorhabdus sp.]MCZ4340500.1 glutathione-dependent disulfide-bond oxidoreductase [Sphingomonadaceae bacterium G21617-S1]TAK11956.1 MAG: glutathione-dependent disulfide-bond oxidoreductase [Rhizorhabdus sp.]
MSKIDFTPPRVWAWDAENGGRFAKLNRPIAGATTEKELPVGKHPFQLYSMGTPNGQKVTIMLEELLEAGRQAAEYDAWLITIFEGDQFSSGFVSINPNSKIPAMVDRSGPKPFRIFESGAILLHLANKFGAFLPTDEAERAETYSWLMWQMGSAPSIGGGFGHFFAYAPEKIEYAINRYAMETKRLFDVADRRLAESRFLAGDTYTIADIATYPWLQAIANDGYKGCAEFLSIHEYRNVDRWLREIAARPAVSRGMKVNRVLGRDDDGLRERHDASDFELRSGETKR